MKTNALFWSLERLECNMGGPRSRTRRELLETTLLGECAGRIRCPRVLHLGLEFGDADPVSLMENLLAEQGLTHPEGLRSQFFIPLECRLCRVDTQLPRLRVATAAREEVLWQGLLLGLCTAVLYDPARPVLWTTTSLTRTVEVYESAGFYA